MEQSAYLGGAVTVEERTLQDVKARIRKTDGVFVEFYPLRKNKDVSMKISIRMFNSTVQSVLLYVCETWRVTTEVTSKLQTFVGRCLRRIMGIRWASTALWEAAGLKPVMLRIRMRKWRWIGHTQRRGVNILKNKHGIGTRREPEGEEDRRKPRK
jgi:hypothetical protein